MIWQMMVGALCLISVVAAGKTKPACEVQSREYLKLDGIDENLANNVLGKTWNFVCKYGKPKKSGECVLQPQCKSEQEWLMGNLTKCLNELISTGATYDDDYLDDLIMFLIARARVFYWKSGLPLELPFLGPRGNDDIDRIILLIPIIYERIVEHYLQMDPADFTFPLPNSPHMKEMVAKILDLSCGSTFTPNQLAAVESSITETHITRFVLLFLAGPATEKLKDRSTYKKLLEKKETDLEKIKKWWKNLLKHSTDPTEELMSECPNPATFGSRDQEVRTSFKKFIEDLKSDHMENFNLRGIHCNDMGIIMHTSVGSSSRSCSGSHSHFGRGGDVMTMHQMFISHFGPHGGHMQHLNNGEWRQP